MAIDFDFSRWEKTKRTYARWWTGTLDRPLVPVLIKNRLPDRPEPAVPLLNQAVCSDLSIPAERLIDRIDYELSQYSYYGDAYPYFNMDCFGPGVIAAFLGGILDNSSGRVWFHAPSDTPIQDLHFQFDPDNIWFRRICEIYKAGMQRWQGQVLMGMTDLGGNLDILSTFRPSEMLLMDFYDEPDEIKRLSSEIHEAWHQYYAALNAVLQPVNPGYSDWSYIYSDQPSYILQSDVSYMIGPEMFDEFGKPELAASCKRLSHSFYHLDGKGQLAHLDSILSIPELNGVQWVPGDGAPNCGEWPEVYRRIAAAQKKIQVLESDGKGFEILDKVIAQIGTAKGIHFLSRQWITADRKTECACLQKLSEYGIE